ncbi:MAG: hypothetical protein ABIH66_03430, partial [bacterium]
MAEKLNVYELRDELWQVAEKEAKKRPNISKEELKRELTEHILDSDILKRILPEGTANAIEKVIGAVTEITIKTLEIYLREKGTGKKRGRPRKKKAKKAEKAVKKEKAAPKKKAKRVKKKAASKKKEAKK